jgi:hypothetical protein
MLCRMPLISIPVPRSSRNVYRTPRSERPTGPSADFSGRSPPQRGEVDFGVRGPGPAPSHDAPAPGVHHRGEMGKALLGRDVGDVARPLRSGTAAVRSRPSSSADAARPSEPSVVVGHNRYPLSPGFPALPSPSTPCSRGRSRRGRRRRDRPLVRRRSLAPSPPGPGPSPRRRPASAGAPSTQPCCPPVVAHDPGPAACSTTCRELRLSPSRSPRPTGPGERPIHGTPACPFASSRYDTILLALAIPPFGVSTGRGEGQPVSEGAAT